MKVHTVIRYVHENKHAFHGTEETDDDDDDDDDDY